MRGRFHPHTLQDKNIIHSQELLGNTLWPHYDGLDLELWLPCCLRHKTEARCYGISGQYSSVVFSPEAWLLLSFLATLIKGFFDFRIFLVGLILETYRDRLTGVSIS